jgi:hypothetical protein
LTPPSASYPPTALRHSCSPPARLVHHYPLPPSLAPSLPLARALALASLGQQHTSHKSTSQSTIDESTKKQLAEVESSMQKNRDAALKKVVDRVLSVEPKLHPNLKKVEA